MTDHKWIKKITDIDAPIYICSQCNYVLTYYHRAPAYYNLVDYEGCKILYTTNRIDQHPKNVMIVSSINEFPSCATLMMKDLLK